MAKKQKVQKPHENKYKPAGEKTQPAKKKKKGK